MKAGANPKGLRPLSYQPQILQKQRIYDIIKKADEPLIRGGFQDSSFARILTMTNHAQLTARDIHGPYTQLLTNLQGENGQEWLSALNRFLRKENPWEKPKATAFFGRHTLVDVPEVDPGMDLETFYQNRPGLYVWDDFTTLVLQPALQADRSTLIRPASMSRRLLKVNATDAVIEEKLGRNYQFSELAAALIIAKMIEAQPNGIAGLLLNNGYANLFYLPTCVVFVHWDADGRGWDVSACRRGAYQWRVGNLVFASN